VIAIISIQKNKLKILNNEKDIKIAHVKLSKIFNKAWPATIFANSRIDKLNKRVTYEIISIRIKKCRIGFGAVG
jgi:hypothetical protein